VLLFDYPKAKGWQPAHLVLQGEFVIFLAQRHLFIKLDEAAI
jgi:hypothetical protein